ncbi:Myosin-2 essential light chain [Astathelohania contejeani]|uniref:Myosin-2 essential light chain n=1 Tax=Astathelohania contejeani TaxID=164912 RepID=A0ABQ7HX93_9MICR|nr:Myosin-2 essential light chain [Thelohania contejeani]
MAHEENVFKMYANDSGTEVDIHKLGDLLRHVGHTVTDHEINSLIAYHKKPTFSYEEFVDICKKVEINDVKKDEFVKALRCYDPENTGFINVAQLTNILKTGENRLDQNEIDELIEIVRPDAEGNFDYNTLAKVIFN